ncbi:C-type lectin domain family 2 member F-like [Vicugna pacos]|uniref:C-type lectin domain family 2 member F-like n=1 Tax=Vicugna pacos TaxID=30538 RepID=A0ABM5CNX2_VICPA
MRRDLNEERLGSELVPTASTFREAWNEERLGSEPVPTASTFREAWNEERLGSEPVPTASTFREAWDEERLGNKRQRKCPGVFSPVTPAKVVCYVTTLIALLATVVVLSVLLAGKNTEYIPYVTCPEGWIGFGSKCFYFSEDSRNWTFSQMFCASLDAGLAQFETKEELKFLRRYKGFHDHWIGLSRESPHHFWQWTDSSAYNAPFAITGDGECAYLNDNGISSARNYTERNWICSKSQFYKIFLQFSFLEEYPRAFLSF